MADLSDDDLKFTLEIEPDTTKMVKEIEGIGERIESESAKIKTAWKAMSDAGAKTLENIRAHERIRAGFARNDDALKAKQAMEEEITAQLEKQKNLSERINAAMDPKFIQERVRIEIELAKAKQKYAQAYTAEMNKQAPQAQAIPKTFLQKIFGGLTDQIKSGKLNVGQVIGSAAGGSIGGGLKGGIGATIGNVVGAAVSGGGAAGAAGGAAGGGAAAGAEGALGLLAAATAEIPPVALAIGAIAIALPIVAGALKGIFDSMAAAVAKASPATFMQLQHAMEDVQGVMGRMFIPIIQLVTSAIRTFGDVLATILPNTGEMNAALAPLREAFEQLNVAIRQFFSENGPAIRGFFVDLIGSAATALAEATQAMTLFIKSLSYLKHALTGDIAGILRDFGVLPGNQDNLRSSQDAAARPASITGIEDYEKNLQISAFSTPAQNYAEQAVQEQETTNSILQAMIDNQRATGNPFNPAGMIASGIARAITGF